MVTLYLLSITFSVYEVVKRHKLSANNLIWEQPSAEDNLFGAVRSLARVLCVRHLMSFSLLLATFGPGDTKFLSQRQLYAGTRERERV
jgi:hypothetical protein